MARHRPLDTPRQRDDSALLVVNDRVPGRVRFRIGSLVGSPPAAKLAEERVLDTPGVLSASASALTGSLLIHFHPGETSLAELKGLIAPIAAIPTRASSPARSPRNGSRSRRPAHARSAPEIARQTEPWHAEPVEQVARELATDPERGLTLKEAVQRIRVYGRNEIPDIPRRSRAAILVDQMVSIPILMLSAASVFSLLTGAAVDALFIVGALAANVALGFFTEDRAEETIQSLRQTRSVKSLVIRQGARVRVESDEIVPGDILVLEPGDVAAADARVIRSESLLMDESLLTGESSFQAKNAAPLQDKAVPIAERANMVYAGSAVAGGRGQAIATETGLATELGHIRTLIRQAPDTPPPMSRELHRLGGTLALAAGGICVLFGAAGLLMGMPLLEVLTIAASLAVSAIPEGMPTVATTTLALGMKRMREHNAIVRRLPAVAALGSATILCIDKTGTLTHNQMRARHFILADEDCEVTRISAGKTDDGANTPQSIRFLRAGQMVAPEEDPLLELALTIGALCTFAELRLRPDGSYEASGSATEQALLLAAVDAGIDIQRLHERLTLKERRDRAAGRNYMATIYQDPAGAQRVFVKGAPEEVLALCRRERSAAGPQLLTSRRRKRILDQNDHLASEGSRVLGLAYASAPAGQNALSDLEWVGLVALEDPLRDEAKGAIEQLAGAGIETLMLTGDQRRTAEAVGQAVGLGHESGIKVADADSIERYLAGGQELPDVLARVSPEHKYRIVQLLQERGHIVMMTGDGINDAPALKAADIGIAMGAKSTQIARDISDMILLDDNLESLPIAVGQGRTIFGNIRKSLRFLLASNLADIGLVGACLALGVSFPLSALQLLWMNLVSDVFPAIALSMEPPEPDVMRKKPRPPKQPLLSKPLWKIIAREAGVIAAATLATYLWSIGRYGLGARARTIAFSTVTLAEVAYALACRTEGKSAQIGSRPQNPYLTLFLGISAAAQIATVVFPPLRLLLGTTPLALVDWAVVAAGAGSVLGLTKLMQALPGRPGGFSFRRRPVALLPAPAGAPAILPSAS